jgi:hypothetical protein
VCNRHVKRVFERGNYVHETPAAGGWRGDHDVLAIADGTNRVGLTLIYLFEPAVSEHSIEARSDIDGTKFGLTAGNLFVALDPTVIPIVGAQPLNRLVHSYIHPHIALLKTFAFCNQSVCLTACYQKRI